MNGEVRIRRIAVAVDASPASQAAAEAAAELASRLGAELLGVFVEDLDMLHATALPFTVEVDAVSAAVRAIDAPRMERQFRGEAARAETRLGEIAARSRVPWRFRVLRGRVAVELLRLATEMDVVSLSRGRHRRRLGSTARELLVGVRGRLLLLPPRPLGRPVAVLFDGGESSRHALAAAAGLQRQRRGGDEELLVLLPAAGEEAERLEEEATSALAAVGIEARFRRLPSSEEQRLGAVEVALGPEDEGVLVLPAGHWLEGEDLLALVDRLDRAVLLVR